MIEGFKCFMILAGHLLGFLLMATSASAQILVQFPAHEAKTDRTSDTIYDGLRSPAVEHRVLISDDGSKSFHAELELRLPEEITAIIERDSGTKLESYDLLDTSWTDEGPLNFHLVLPTESGGRMRLLAPRDNQPARKFVELSAESGGTVQYELLSAKTIGESGNRMLASTLRIRLPKSDYHVLVTLAVAQLDEWANIDRYESHIRWFGPVLVTSR